MVKTALDFPLSLRNTCLMLNLLYLKNHYFSNADVCRNLEVSTAKIVGDLVCLLFHFSIFVYKHGFGSVFPLLPLRFFYRVAICRKSFTTGCHCLIVLNICFNEALKKLSPHSGLLIANQGSAYMQHPMFQCSKI